MIKSQDIIKSVQLLDQIIDDINSLEKYGLSKEPNMRLEFLDEAYELFKLFSVQGQLTHAYTEQCLNNVFENEYFNSESRLALTNKLTSNWNGNVEI